MTADPLTPEELADIRVIFDKHPEVEQTATPFWLPVERLLVTAEAARTADPGGLREAARDLYSIAVGEHGHDETHSADGPSCLPAHMAMNRYRRALTPEATAPDRVDRFGRPRIGPRRPEATAPDRTGPPTPATAPSRRVCPACGDDSSHDWWTVGDDSSHDWWYACDRRVTPEATAPDARE